MTSTKMVAAALLAWFSLSKAASSVQVILHPRAGIVVELKNIIKVEDSVPENTVCRWREIIPPSALLELSEVKPTTKNEVSDNTVTCDC